MRSHSSMMYLDWVAIAIGGFLALQGDSLGWLIIGAGVLLHLVHPED
ncbi:MAG: hypothetical protein QXR53_00225 [Candidatus Norongarragalinales archaeon]